MAFHVPKYHISSVSWVTYSVLSVVHSHIIVFYVDENNLFKCKVNDEPRHPSSVNNAHTHSETKLSKPETQTLTIVRFARTTRNAEGWSETQISFPRSWQREIKMENLNWIEQNLCIAHNSGGNVCDKFKNSIRYPVKSAQLFVYRWKWRVFFFSFIFVFQVFGSRSQTNIVFLFFQPCGGRKPFAMLSNHFPIGSGVWALSPMGKKIVENAGGVGEWDGASLSVH